MILEAALRECLHYIRQTVPPLDEAALARLQPPTMRLDQLPGETSVEAHDDFRLRTEASLPATLLRSPALQPLAGSLLRTPEGAYRDWVPDGEAQVQRVLEARRRRCAPLSAQAAGDLETWVQAELLRPHALMLVEPETSLSDGAAWAASSGYLDDDNLPPGDTWVTVLPAEPGQRQQAWLVAWVPAWAEPLVTDGISVNPEECLGWATVRGDEIIWETPSWQ